MPTKIDVAVIGAGLSGLYAARKLSSAGARVAVFEARDRVGGLTFSPRSDVLEARYDLGGQWVSVRHARMQELIARYKVRLIKQWWRGDRIRLHGGEIFRGAADIVPGLSDQQVEEQRVGLQQLYSAFEQISQNAWDSPGAAQLDSMTFAGWAEKIAHSEAVKGWFIRMTSAYYGADARKISALEAISKMKHCGGPIFMSDVEDGGQSTHLVGSAAVSEGMAQELDSVNLSSPVRKVEWSSKGVVIHTDSGTTHARYLVCAISPVLATRVRFDPPLPGEQQQMLQQYAIGRYTKAVLVYDRQFWREKGLNGNVIATDGSITSFYDMGDHSSERPIIAGLFGGIAAEGIDRLTAEARKEKIIAIAKRALGSEAARPIAYYDQIWAHDEWSCGASSPYALPGMLTTFGNQVRAPTGPIHWAGGHMAREFRGYMEGALSSGQDAADAIMSLEG